MNEPGITIHDVSDIIHGISDPDLLDKLLYYSLFDTRSNFEEEKEKPDRSPEKEGLKQREVNELTEKRKEVLSKVYNNQIFLENEGYYDRFAEAILDEDILCKILIRKQLSMLGLTIKPVTKDDSFDLIIVDDKVGDISVELKRIHAWSNYAQYFEEFYDKTDKNTYYALAVLCTHPEDIEKTLRTRLTPKEIDDFNKYIADIIKGHYIIERLHDDFDEKTGNIALIIEHVLLPKKGKQQNYLYKVSDHIKRKISKFWQ